MKKLFALAVALGLAGCNSVAINPIPVPTGTTPVPAPVVEPTVTVSSIQSTVVKACGFLPAATTIATILNASPTVLSAAQIAQMVCDAVTKKGISPSKYAPPAIVVGNKVVLINGEFVKK